jgi:hypothetical protein
LLELKRPNKTRFEIMAMTQKSVRIFDGANGWKMRPSKKGVPELQPYTAEELTFAQEAHGITGPLMDYAAKGAAITLAGIDEFDGRKAYRLNLALRSGATHRLWVDAETYLETRSDRDTRNARGQSGIVSVVYRNYQSFEGLQIPLIIETGAAAAAASDKLVIEKIALNPELEERMFARPNVSVTRSRGATVDTRVPPPGAAQPGR